MTDFLSLECHSISAVTERLSGLAVGIRGQDHDWFADLTVMKVSNRCLTTAMTPVPSEISLFLKQSQQILLSHTVSSSCVFCSLKSLADIKQFFCIVLSVRLGIRGPKCTLGCLVSAVSGTEGCQRRDDVISCLTPSCQIDSDKKIPHRPHGQTSSLRSISPAHTQK